MALIALMTWSGAVLLGLYMLTVWLIENDATGRGAAPSQLPSPVVFTHLALALTGLATWGLYLLTDREQLAWVAVGLLSVIVLLGLLMFTRWIPVHRGPDESYAHPAYAGHAADLPAEGNFPVAVVACHGVLATITYILVLLTALGVGGS